MERVSLPSSGAETSWMWGEWEIDDCGCMFIEIRVIGINVAGGRVFE